MPFFDPKGKKLLCDVSATTFVAIIKINTFISNTVRVRQNPWMLTRKRSPCPNNPFLLRLGLLALLGIPPLLPPSNIPFGAYLLPASYSLPLLSMQSGSAVTAPHADDRGNPKLCRMNSCYSAAHGRSPLPSPFPTPLSRMTVLKLWGGRGRKSVLSCHLLLLPQTWQSPSSVSLVVGCSKLFFLTFFTAGNLAPFPCPPPPNFLRFASDFHKNLA